MENIEKHRLSFSDIFGNGLNIKPEYPGVISFIPKTITEILQDTQTTDTASFQPEIKELVSIISKGGE